MQMDIPPVTLDPVLCCVPRDNVRKYLRILAAFKYLLASVPLPEPSNIEHPCEQFYHRSTYRLELWLKKIVTPGTTPSLDPKELPPLDVAMALHSYMLSPQRYYEDAEIRFSELKRIGDFPLTMIVAVLLSNNQGYDLERSKVAADYWTEQTGLPFDPIQSLHNDNTRIVTCPFEDCGVDTEVPWQSFHDDGQVQYVCGCRRSITEEGLCVKKFLDALNQAREHPDRLCLPNTANLTEGKVDLKLRARLVPLVYDALVNSEGVLPTVEEILVNSGMVWTHNTIKSNVDRNRFRVTSVPIILYAFEYSSPFTQDIVAALRHHCEFINDPCLQEWYEHVPSDEKVDGAYTLYTGFLNSVLKEGRRQPGWRDDLIWHTHQLMPENYRKFVVAHLGVFLDHLIPGEDLNAHRVEYDRKRFPDVVTIWRRVPRTLFSQLVVQGKGIIICDDGCETLADRESCLAGFAAHAFLCCDPGTTEAFPPEPAEPPTTMD